MHPMNCTVIAVVQMVCKAFVGGHSTESYSIVSIGDKVYIKASISAPCHGFRRVSQDRLHQG